MTREADEATERLIFPSEEEVGPVIFPEEPEVESSSTSTTQSKLLQISASHSVRLS